MIGDGSPGKRKHDSRTRVVRCTECGCSSGVRWWGWRAYRTDETDLDEPPPLAFYCPGCAEREFG